MNYKSIKITLAILVIINFLLGALGFLHINVKSYVEKGFILNGKDKVTINFGEDYYEKGYLSNIKASTIDMTNNIDMTKVGEYEVKYTLKFLNYNKSLTRKIEVVDNEAPTIKLDCKDEINIAVDSKFEGCKYTVEDNYDSKDKLTVSYNTNLNTSKPGDYEAVYTVYDTHNNKSEKKITIHVKDKFEMTYIKVSISNQQLDYYENGELYLTTPITSGSYNRTPKGKFKILNKARKTVLKSKYYASYVEYWMGFQGHKYGIHDASWRNNFGNKNYYYNGSHGCVNTPIKAMEKLYERVEIGTPVYIED